MCPTDVCNPRFQRSAPTTRVSIPERIGDARRVHHDAPAPWAKSRAAARAVDPRRCAHDPRAFGCSVTIDAALARVPTAKPAAAAARVTARRLHGPEHLRPPDDPCGPRHAAAARTAFARRASPSPPAVSRKRLSVLVVRTGRNPRAARAASWRPVIFCRLSRAASTPPPTVPRLRTAWRGAQVPRTNRGFELRDESRRRAPSPEPACALRRRGQLQDVPDISRRSSTRPPRWSAADRTDLP